LSNFTETIGLIANFIVVNVVEKSIVIGRGQSKNLFTLQEKKFLDEPEIKKAWKEFLKRIGYLIVYESIYGQVFSLTKLNVDLLEKLRTPKNPDEIE